MHLMRTFMRSLTIQLVTATRLSQLLAACGGFLLAVLWMDLIFDVLVYGLDADVLPESVLDPIATYYRRVALDASSMRYFIAIVMFVTLAGSTYQALTSSTRHWRRIASLATCSSGIALGVL